MVRRTYRRRTYRRYRPRRTVRTPIRARRRRNYRTRRPNGNPRRRGIATERNFMTNFQGDRAIAKFKCVQYTNLQIDSTGSAANYYGGNYVFPADTRIPNLNDFTGTYRKARIRRCSIVVTFANTGTTHMRTVGITQLLTDVGVMPNTGTAGVALDEQPRTTYKTIGPLSSSKSVVTLKATGTTGTAYGSRDYSTLAAGDFIVTTPATGLNDVPQYAWRWGVWAQDPFTPIELPPISVKVALYYTVEFSQRNIETA